MNPKALDYHANSREYYGTTLGSKDDLKTSACCANEAPPAWLRPLFSNLHPEVIEKSYGCGSPIPVCLEGCTVLDLGCGTGRDVFLASQLVGPEGRVIGVDFTDGQLDVASRQVEWHRQKFGFARANTDFRKGPLEDLAALGIEDDSVDVVISNCVLNLCPDKGVVLREIARVLKPGGELYFSDVFASRRIPTDLANDPAFHGECLGGAWYWEDFRRVIGKALSPDFRVVSRSRLSLEDPHMATVSEGIDFDSATVRAFHIDSIEDRCEDYGQTVMYKGTVSPCGRIFQLDPAHRFEVGRPERVCGNTAAMLAETRFGRHFEVLGDRSSHFGLFPRGEVEEGNDSPRCC